MSNKRRTSTIADLLREVLTELGEDPDRNGVRETPLRWAKALLDATKGGEVTAKEHLKFFDNDNDYRGPVEVHGIDFHSTCEHHILPFFGKVNITYIPTETILGLSKFPRIVDAFARQLNNQERLTAQLCSFLHTYVAKHVSVEIIAEHACICSRGVEKHGVMTRTFEASSPEMLVGNLQRTK